MRKIRLLLASLAVVGAVGCTEEAAQLQAKAGDTVCAWADKAKANIGPAIGVVEDAVLTAGAMRATDLAEGKAIVAQVQEAAHVPIAETAAMVGEIDCETLATQGEVLAQQIQSALGQ